MKMPAYLKESLNEYKKGLEKIARGEKYFRIDCDFCNLQNDINTAELSQLISEEEAYFLRGKYLYDYDAED